MLFRSTLCGLLDSVALGFALTQGRDPGPIQAWGPFYCMSSPGLFQSLRSHSHCIHGATVHPWLILLKAKMREHDVSDS